MLLVLRRRHDRQERYANVSLARLLVLHLPEFLCQSMFAMQQARVKLSLP